MHSDRTRAALADVLRNIELAESFARDVPLQQFMDDVIRVYATTRALEIISEASRRLVTATTWSPRKLFGRPCKPA